MARKRIQGTDRLFEETEAITSMFAEGEELERHFVPVHRLVPNRFNPRQVYARENLDGLASSMQEYGFIGALDGRELSDGRVELAYGSRRLLAAKMTSIRTVPVFLHDWDDDQMRFIAVVENLTREDLTPIDEAATVGRMRDDLGLSTREIGRRISKARSWVQDRLALSDAPRDVKDMVASRPDTLRAARFISRLTDQESRLALQEKVVQQDITTRQIQLVVQKMEQGMSVEDALITVVAPIQPQKRVSFKQTEQAGPVAGGPVDAFVPPGVETDAVSEPLEEAARDETLMTSVTPSQSPVADSTQVFEQEVSLAAALAAAQASVQSSHETPAGVRASVSTRDTSLVPDRGWIAAGRPLIVLAVEAVDSFDPDALPADELEDVLDWLRQLAVRTNSLVQSLEKRL